MHALLPDFIPHCLHRHSHKILSPLLVIILSVGLQVGILVGKGGSALKKLGAEARRDIELFLERPVSEPQALMHGHIP